MSILANLLKLLLQSLREAVMIGSRGEDTNKGDTIVRIERELFSWTDGDWDGDYECMTFYDVTLRVPIGKYTAGQTFDFAVVIQTDDGTILQLTMADIDSPDLTDVYCPVKVMGEYRLHYQVGETLSEV